MKCDTRWITGLIVVPLGIVIIVASIVLFQQIRQDNLDHALIEAAKKLDAPAVERMLKAGANPNAKDTGEPPLTFSRLVQRLIARLQRKAVNDTGKDAEPALLVVSANPKQREAADTIAVALLARGADYRVDLSGSRTIHFAAFYGMPRTLRQLLARGENVDQRGSYGVTPLMIAVAEEHVESVKILLEKGADVNAVDESGNSALFDAILNSRPPNPERAEIIRLLKQFGARLNNKDKAYLAQYGR